jgi:hypothetical protein
MTTFADFHLAVRHLVGGRGTFVVTVQSTELHPGRVDVQWSVVILLSGKPNIVAHSLSPSIVLEQLERQMQGAVPSLAPPELRNIGEPPATEPAAEPGEGEPDAIDLVNIRGDVVGRTKPR